jgi:hypothetical protein
MKRIIFITLLSFFSLVVLSQGETDRQVTSSLYLTAGGNFSGVTGWDDPATAGAGRLPGFNAGMTFWTNLSKRGYSQLYIEANFSQQGFLSTEASADADNEKMIVNYINIPVVYRYRPFKSFDAMYIGAGPQIGFKVGGHIKNVGGEKLELNEDAFAKNSWSALGVLGFNFGNYANWGIEFGYQHGLTKFMNDYPDLRHSVMSARLILPIDFVSAVAAGL